MTLDFDKIIDAYTATLRQSLNGYDNTQLQELLRDESKIDALITNQNQINLLPELRNDKLRLCKWFADINISMKPKFEELKTTLNNDVIELRHLNIEIQKLKRELDSASDSRRLDVADGILSVAIRQAEEKSEIISDDFVAGRLPIDDFLTKFDDSRKIYHMRKLKASKLAELLKYQQY